VTYIILLPLLVHVCNLLYEESDAIKELSGARVSVEFDGITLGSNNHTEPSLIYTLLRLISLTQM